MLVTLTTLLVENYSVYSELVSVSKDKNRFLLFNFQTFSLKCCKSFFFLFGLQREMEICEKSGNLSCSGGTNNSWTPET